MRNHRLTQHALVRQQQRCVPALVIDWLLSYGKRESSFGAIRVRFDRRAKKELARDVGARAVSMMAKYLNAALIVDREHDIVITVEWLH